MSYPASIEVKIQRLKILRRLYTTIEDLFPSLGLEYEGEILKLGDTVTVRSPTVLFGPSDLTYSSVTVSEKLSLNLSEETLFRELFSDVPWHNVQFLVINIVDCDLVYGWRSK